MARIALYILPFILMAALIGCGVSGYPDKHQSNIPAHESLSDDATIKLVTEEFQPTLQMEN